MFLLILNLIASIALIVMALHYKTINDRGTNAVTRFVRDVSANAGYDMVIAIGLSVTCGCLFLGLLFKAVYACIPSVLVVVLGFVLKFKSTKNKQRVEDSRVVTKAGGKVVAATGTAAVAVGATVATGGLAAPAAAAIVAGSTAAAKGVTNVIDKSMDQMTDVNGPDIKREDFKELNAFAEKFSGISIEHPEEFIEAANRAGIETNGRDLREVASNVIQFAPPAMLAELPEEMSVEEKAMRVMGGMFK